MAVMAVAGEPRTAIRAKLPFVVGAVSFGTLLEWYDFYLYGALATVLAAQFFPGNLAHGFLYGLGLVWTGMVLRPVGALVLGYVGDAIGRKFALVLALAAMGASSFGIGCLPGFARIGWSAPVLLVLLRAVQGLALGGEYGAAATYVAEHAPDGKRGFYTAWIQATATMGIVLALLVIFGCRRGFGDAAFADWAWRVPFWISAILVLVSIGIRLKLEESPLFARLKTQGGTAQNPVRESLSSGKNGRPMVLALFGATAPEGVVWYTGQFYALFYLTTVLKLPYVTVYGVMMVVLVCAAPLFVVFGALSDRVGRRNILTLGFLLAAIGYWPVFSSMAQVKDNPFLLGVLVFALVIPVTMAYGPIAALLVELFPARIRCTSTSLSYHVGNGVFGGLVPLAGVWIATAFGGPLYALFYPIGVALLGAGVSIAGLPTRSDQVRIWDEAGGAPPPVPHQP